MWLTTNIHIYLWLKIAFNMWIWIPCPTFCIIFYHIISTAMDLQVGVCYLEKIKICADPVHFPRMWDAKNPQINNWLKQRRWSYILKFNLYQVHYSCQVGNMLLNSFGSGLEINAFLGAGGLFGSDDN
jgi:hypothetical protein